MLMMLIQISFKKLMTVIDKIGPYKSKRVKGNTQKWFDGEVLEKLNLIQQLLIQYLIQLTISN